MNELMMKLKILFRSEMMLLKTENARRMNAALLSAIAVGALLIAILFLNIGLFYTFSENAVYANAAFWLALLNVVIAAIPLLIVKTRKASAEEALVQSIRDMAMEELTQDFTKANQEFEDLGKRIKQVKSGLSSVGTGGLTGMGPLLGLAIELLKKK